MFCYYLYWVQWSRRFWKKFDQCIFYVSQNKWISLLTFWLCDLILFQKKIARVILYRSGSKLTLWNDTYNVLPDEHHESMKKNIFHVFFLQNLVFDRFDFKSLYTYRFGELVLIRFCRELHELSFILKRIKSHNQKVKSDIHLFWET